MSNEFGQYAFLTWLRRGVSTGIKRLEFSEPASDGSDLARATLNISVNVNGTSIPVEGLALQGPGEVTGFDARVVVRTWPRPDVYDVEDNYFPLIELGQPDLPWRYTPARAKDEEDRLRPWFCLIALKDDEIEKLETANVGSQDRPCPVLQVKKGTALPKLSQAWAWAHVQVTGQISETNPPKSPEKTLQTYLRNEPQRLVARLLCPRRLDPKTAYTVFVVPTFERGRLAGLGQKVEETIDALQTSWMGNEAPANLELPIYYRWRFQTGLDGDFEYLVSLLKKEPLSNTVGKRDLDVSDPGAGLPKASEEPMGLEGALKAPGVTSTWDENETRRIWVAKLKEVLNGPSALLAAGPRVRILSGASDFQRYIYEGRSALPESIVDFTCILADWNGDRIPDLFAIRELNTETGRIEVHILSGASGFQHYLLRPSETDLGEGDGWVDFQVADWKGDGKLDLIAFRPGDNSTQIRILDGWSNFTNTLLDLEVPLELEGAPQAYRFSLADWDKDGTLDLFAIKKGGVPRNSDRVYIFSGASEFRERLLNVGTPLDKSHEWEDFYVVDWNGDGRPDVVTIKKYRTDLRRTEVYILNGATEFQKYLLKTPTSLEEADDIYDFALTDWDGDGKPDLVAIRRYAASTKQMMLPLYGRWHAAQTLIAPDDPRAEAPWFHELNIDPRLRVAASLGTDVVQSQQQQLMASAWRQVEGIRKINTELRQAQLAREVAMRVYERHIVVADVESILHVTAPVQGRIQYTFTTECVRNNSTRKTVKSWLEESPIAEGIFEAQWRRVARPLGPLGRRQGRASDSRVSDILKRMNLNQDDPERLWVAKPPPTPSDISTCEGAGLKVHLSGQKLTDYLTEFNNFPGPDTDPREYNPDNPDYSFEEPDEDPTPGSGNSWNPLKAATEDLLKDLSISPVSAKEHCRIKLEDLTKELVKQLDPQVTINKSYDKRLSHTKEVAWQQGGDPLGQVMAAPEFPQPMFEPLRELSQDWLLPGLDKVPPNIISLLETNESFVEAYMVGLNHEMARELLWNGYPTDQRGSYFRQFWDPSGRLTSTGGLPESKTLKDIEELHKWGELGKNNNPDSPTSGEKLVLLIRGELLRRYPNALLYATRATYKNGKRDLTNEQDLNFAEQHPLFSGTFKPDVSFFAFNLTKYEARGCPLNPDGIPVSTNPNEQGWYFVLQEQPSEMRFGLNSANKDNTGVGISDWDDLSWGHLADGPVSTEAEVLKKMAAIDYIDFETGKPKILDLVEASAFNGTATFSTAPLNHYLQIGDKVIVSGVTPSAYNGERLVAAIPSSDKFTASIRSTPGIGTAFGIIYPFGATWHADRGSHAADIAYITCQEPVRVAIHASDMLPERKALHLIAASASANVATFTTAADHPLKVGDKVTVSGVTPDAYNGEWVVATIPSSDKFTASIRSTPENGTAFGVVYLY